ncbi:uncharacterized protein LOC127494270 [Ctenopharyngodon idella]|uniref:uncharacterized protein LOC127494270 n=1 Tax=Ctenopharyngodon idella TaxID=7959 RepID=UPI002231DCD1|nr:uncharacterized protein LOC127494270 [Ctenopharyngodon idella]
MANAQQITKLNVSTCKNEEEILRAQGYHVINVNLNEGTGGNRVLLWYKKVSGETPVTRIEFSFTDKMKSGLADAGYELVNKDLNAGVSGDHISLWYFCGSTEYDIPIVELEVSIDAKEEPALLKDGWERLGCNLNRNARGNFIYLWVKREKTSYIQEVAASVDFSSDKHMFDLGYTRVDEDTNRGSGGNYVFLWYRRTTDKSKALTALDVSTSHQEEEKLRKQGYKVLSVDLNKGTSGKVVFLWYKKEGGHSIQAMVLLIDSEAWIEYQKAGINFIDKNLNEGNNGWKMHIAYN